MKVKSTHIARVILLSFVLLVPLVLADEGKKEDIWVSVDERSKIWDSIAGKGNYKISWNSLEATFEKDGAKWTIIGANAPIVYPTVYPKDWPVKGDDFEVLVIPEPITDYKILPYSDKIANAVKTDSLNIIGAPDSYEPVSFVIRSGDADLKDVMVEVTDLKAQIIDNSGKTETAILPKDNIDIRVVKCWYQAGVGLADTEHKTLTPELLLHDDDLVRVDYERQVNIVRNKETVNDSQRLRPFLLPKRQNKQIWLTAHFEDRVPPGKYKGDLIIKIGDRPAKKMVLNLEVLPFILPEPMLDYALYYEGMLSGSMAPEINAAMKTEKQMKAELTDMKEHGLTNATVWHRVSKDRTKWIEDWKRLEKTLDLRKEIGWDKKPLLYLDWKTSFREDRNAYSEKIKKIQEIAQKKGIEDVYIYGVDEVSGKTLLDLINGSYKQVNALKAKTFVAGFAGGFLEFPDNPIDLYVIAGPIVNTAPKDIYQGATSEQIAMVKTSGKKVYIYGNPQAGLEQPETYRKNFGFELVKSHADGALDYAYQTGGTLWNDFDNPGLRYHVMAYPTIEKPIPTVQWEGWREGVNDVRYLTLLKKRGLYDESFLMGQCQKTASDCRERVISKLKEN